MVKYKASSIANPIQGLIKYHGNIDEEIILPAHNSFSVNIEGLYTHTTVEFSDKYDKDILFIDRKLADMESHIRAKRVLDMVRKIANIDLYAKIIL